MFIGVVSLVLLAVLISAGVNFSIFGFVGIHASIILAFMVCVMMFSTFILSTLLNRIIELSECG